MVDAFITKMMDTLAASCILKRVLLVILQSFLMYCYKHPDENIASSVPALVLETISESGPAVVRALAGGDTVERIVYATILPIVTTVFANRPHSDLPQACPDALLLLSEPSAQLDDAILSLSDDACTSACTSIVTLLAESSPSSPFLCALGQSFVESMDLGSKRKLLESVAKTAVHLGGGQPLNIARGPLRSPSDVASAWASAVPADIRMRSALVRATMSCFAQPWMDGAPEEHATTCAVQIATAAANSIATALASSNRSAAVAPEWLRHVLGAFRGVVLLPTATALQAAMPSWAQSVLKDIRKIVAENISSIPTEKSNADLLYFVDSVKAVLCSGSLEFLAPAIEKVAKEVTMLGYPDVDLHDAVSSTCKVWSSVLTLSSTPSSSRVIPVVLKIITITAARGRVDRNRLLVEGLTELILMELPHEAILWRTLMGLYPRIDVPFEEFYDSAMLPVQGAIDSVSANLAVPVVAFVESATIPPPPPPGPPTLPSCVRATVNAVRASAGARPTSASTTQSRAPNEGTPTRERPRTPLSRPSSAASFRSNSPIPALPSREQEFPYQVLMGAADNPHMLTSGSIFVDIKTQHGTRTKNKMRWSDFPGRYIDAGSGTLGSHQRHFRISVTNLGPQLAWLRVEGPPEVPVVSTKTPTTPFASGLSTKVKVSVSYDTPGEWTGYVTVYVTDAVGNRGTIEVPIYVHVEDKSRQKRPT